jgi:hypothetical protein
VGFETTIPAFERAKTVDASDRAATVIGKRLVTLVTYLKVFIVQAYQTSQDVVPCGGTFLGKWRCSFAGSSDGKMNVQSACALNTRYNCTSSMVRDLHYLAFEQINSFSLV